MSATVPTLGSAVKATARPTDRTVSLRKAGDIRITIEDEGQITYDPASVAQHWKPKKD